MLDNEEREIMETDGVKHSVPLDEIVTGCPGLDCIPSVDKPVFESIAAADKWLASDDIGLAVNHKGIDRFYPFRILVSHEIVNDTYAGDRVLVTYCPLCFTAIVFDPVVQGERVEFGVSGKLRNSNLLMYDRSTKSLWSQISGEAVVGEATGSKLRIISSDVTKFGLWREKFSQGEVLSRETGRLLGGYDSIPYGGDLTNIEPFFPYANSDDTRLPVTAYVLGVVVEGVAKAYSFEAVKEAGSFTDSVGGTSLQVTYVSDEDSVRIVDAASGERIAAVPAFWFSWAATYPNTELYQ